MALGWAVFAFAHTSAVVLTTASAGTRGASDLLYAFLFLVGSYTPWALATPMLLGLSGRWITGTGRSVYHLIWFALFGLPAIPLLTGVGWGLGHGVLNMFALAGQGQSDLHSSQRALMAHFDRRVWLLMVVFQVWDGRGSLKSRDGVRGAEGMPTVEMELGT